MRYRINAEPLLRMRSGPGQEYPIIDRLPNGTHVENAQAGWLYVRAGQRTGWVYANHLVQVEGEPAWLRFARGELGTSEVPGPGDNPRIVHYHSFTSLKATDDEIAWCSSFACCCMEEGAGIESPRSARARDWLKWGVAIDKPVLGCIVVLRRGANPDAGHVGLFDHDDPQYDFLLGGNQKNQVSISPFSKAEVLGYRIPA